MIIATECLYDLVLLKGLAPITSTSPLSGTIIPDNILISVVLPAPFFPIIPNISPWETEKVIFARAIVDPQLPKILE